VSRFGEPLTNAMAGMTQKGNINLHNRPKVKNPDGSISTVRSISVTDNAGRATLIPTVVGNKVVSNDDAIRNYQKTGQHLGQFLSETLANRYAKKLHEQQAKEYTPLQKAATTKLGKL
jgi:ribosomal protein S3AE